MAGAAPLGHHEGRRVKLRKRKSATAKAVDKADEAKATGRKAKRTAKKAGKKAAKKAGPAPRNVVETLTDPKTARRAVSAAKIAGPVLAPIALKASISLRGYLDGRRADQLGVPVDEVSVYRGPTGPTAARIVTLQQSVDELRRRRGSDLQVSRFVAVARTRLEDLATAVRAAGAMPSGRRRSTLRAIGRDLDGIDADLMTFLVGTAA